MSEQIVSALCLTSGVAAMGIGWLLARDRVKRTARVHRKRGMIHATMPEGWGGWFFQGFAGVSMGTRWVVAVSVLVFWFALGVGLVSLGVRLVW